MGLVDVHVDAYLAKGAIPKPHLQAPARRCRRHEGSCGNVRPAWETCGSCVGHRGWQQKLTVWSRVFMWFSMARCCAVWRRLSRDLELLESQKGHGAVWRGSWAVAWARARGLRGRWRVKDVSQNLGCGNWDDQNGSMVAILELVK